MKKTARLVHLIHNPNAGEGEYSKDHIISLIEEHGYKCAYSTSKELMLERIDPATDFIAIAGGDGTIRRTIMNLLDQKLKYKRPIALLPFGTANNIATSLGIPQDNVSNISSWTNGHLKKYDVGQITGNAKTAYFIEAFGFGIFTRLMNDLKETDTSGIKTPEQEFAFALKEALRIAQTYEPVSYNLNMDGQQLTGRALWIEVMNISSLGPRLTLSLDADPGDGYFDVVVVNEEERPQLEKYISDKCASKNPVFPFKSIRAKKLQVEWAGKDVHIDDEIFEASDPAKFDVFLLDSLIEIVTAD
ncbi:diacylglycerol/lipid kinase family protein [Pedobacter faecalis]|uniref:diacylglycerol/lipid kinase family protein n=1 Tax=Pedobacter faecalis TaxID=3041495 RepID=UPI002551AAD7|nr:diacylglycerol kinase family protein [Pedobacter sp. ELA7]